MDDITTKAIMIGVSIFVTLIILTVIIFEFTSIQDIYKETAEIDISFEERLDEFDKYDNLNNEFNGLDVRNTIAKYSKDDLVDVCLEEDDAIYCDDTSSRITKNEYSKKYKSRLQKETNKYTIIFEEK